MRIHSRPAAFLHILRKGIGSHCKNRNRPGVTAVQRSDFLRGLVTIHFRHENIHQNIIIEALRGSGKFLHGNFSVLSHICPCAGCLNYFGGNFPVQFVIFHDQDAFTCKLLLFQADFFVFFIFRLSATIG